jgi:hypothetical protein
VKVGAREELLAAARSLEDRAITVFSPAQLIAEARLLGTSYPDTTLRTFITGPMCVNSPDHHAVQYGDLVRVARGLYRRVSGEWVEADPATVGPEAPVDAVLESAPIAHDEEWFWEGNVQAAVVGHLVAEGWRIRRVANTATSEHGVDIEAERRGERLAIEVKGYPGATYARGDRKGEAKTTPAAAQARAYFSNALLSGLLMRADTEAPGARVVLAFPDVATFNNLGRRVSVPLAAAGIEVWFVREDGGVVAPAAD